MDRDVDEAMNEWMNDSMRERDEGEVVGLTFPLYHYEEGRKEYIHNT